MLSASTSTKYSPIRSGGCVLQFLLVPVLELTVSGHPQHYRACSSKKRVTQIVKKH